MEDDDTITLELAPVHAGSSVSQILTHFARRFEQLAKAEREYARLHGGNGRHTFEIHSTHLDNASAEMREIAAKFKSEPTP